MLMSNIRLNTKAERKKLLRKKKPPKVDTREIGIKKNEFQLELKNRFTALQELDDIDTLNENITETIQQTATSIAKQNTKRDKSRLSTQTRVLMKKRREMLKNTARDYIEYTEICKTLKKKAKEDIRKYNLDSIRKTIETSQSLNKVRRTHILGQNRLITLLDNQGRKIQDQDNIFDRIEEFYTEFYDSDQTVTIRTDPREVPSVTTWEVEAALKKMKNGKATGNDQVNIDTLKAEEDTIAKALAKLYTKCI